MKTFKRLLCLLLALCLCAGLLAGCGADKGRQEAVLHVYDTEDTDVGIEEIVEGYNDVIFAGDRLYTIGYTYTDNGTDNKLISVKPDGTDLQELPLVQREFDPEKGWGSIQNLLTDGSGTLYTVEYISQSSGDENDWSYTEQYFINQLAADGSVAATVELEIPEDTWADTYLTLCTGEDFLIPCQNDLLQVNMDGTHRTIQVLTNGNGYINRLFRLADGTVVVYYYGGEDWTPHYTKLDLAAGKLGEELAVPEEFTNGTLVFDPNGQMYMYDVSGIYRCDLEAGTMELLCSWLDSDIDFDPITGLFALEDGRFIAVSRGEEWNKMILSTMTWVDPATLPEKVVLTLACSYSWEMQRAALKFNRASDTTRITLVDYSKYNTQENEWTGAVTQMNTDIITGKVPDLLLVDSSLPFQNYVAKGLFTDLYPLLDADEDLSREDLVQSVLTACEADGKLMSIVPGYGIVTLAGPAGIVGDKPGWTWDEFFALLEQYPQCKTAIPYFDRASMLNVALILGGTEYVDYSTGRCSFDSEGFIRLLEYAATYPESVDYDEYISEKELFADGRALLMQIWMSSFADYIREYPYMMNDTVIYKGLPTADGTGSGSAVSPNLQLAISEACPDKAAAWEFVSYFLSEEYQTEEMHWQLPLRRDVLQLRIEEAMNPENDDYGIAMPAIDIAVEEAVVEETVVEEPVDGEAVEEETEDVADEEIIVDDGIADMLPGEDMTEENYWNRPITQEEVDRVLALIDSTTTLYQWDSSLMDIILEEVEAFFAGTKTAQETAAIIQNRAQTYISESR